MRYVMIGLLAVLIGCDNVPADATSSEARAGRAMFALVEQSQAFGRVQNVCPVSAYNTRTYIPGTVADCSRSPEVCLSQCESGNRDACFSAARVIENGNVADRSEATFPLFMAACALGDENACVNAGATVKNGDWAGARPARADTAQCQFQTYDRMCRNDAPWGCYMVAQEYLRNDGFRPRSDPLYERNMRRACQLAPDSGACLDAFR
jgi:TPR repeat protein